MKKYLIMQTVFSRFSQCSPESQNAPKLNTTHRKSQNPIALKCLENTLFRNLNFEVNFKAFELIWSCCKIRKRLRQYAIK